MEIGMGEVHPVPVQGDAGENNRRPGSVTRPRTVIPPQARKKGGNDVPPAVQEPAVPFPQFWRSREENRPAPSWLTEYTGVFLELDYSRKIERSQSDRTDDQISSRSL